MDPNAKKKLIGAVIAAALAIAVYYGFIDQKQATNLQNQANQTLGTAPAQQTTPQTRQTNAQVPAGQQAPTEPNTAQQAPAQQPAPPSAPAPQNTEPSQPK